MSWWKVTAVTNLVITLAYFAIAYAIASSLLRTRQWRENPLALATAAEGEALTTERMRAVLHEVHNKSPSLFRVNLLQVMCLLSARICAFES